MKTTKYILSFALAALALLGMNSCSKDKLGDTIFPDVSQELDPNSYTYQLDKWLQDNFLKVYNLDFRYKMQDVGTDMNYNLVPAAYDKSVDLAVLTKYLWFDTYKEVVNSEFLKQYGPRIIHLIGSPAYSPQTGTMILGLAEGGIKVSLYRVNTLDPDDFEQLNEYYFKTMHHEFGHILHQTKPYPTTFAPISNGHYDAANWQDRHEGVCASLGFTSNYASSEVREDFAETVANYITKTDEQWEQLLKDASRGWTTDPNDPDEFSTAYYCFYYYPNNEVIPNEEPSETNKAVDNRVYVEESEVRFEVDEQGKMHQYWRERVDDKGERIVVHDVEDKDGIDGKEAILKKVDIVRQWFKDSWKVDFDALRQEVQIRQVSYDMEELRKQVYDIK